MLASLRRKRLVTSPLTRREETCVRAKLDYSQYYLLGCIEKSMGDSFKTVKRQFWADRQ